MRMIVGKPLSEVTGQHLNYFTSSISSLLLDWNTKDSTVYGFYKTPIAAGRGSGNLKFDIVPGKPNESILFYRMESIDPGIMMSELGRSQQHTEGVKLIKEWIKSMQN